MTTKKLTFHTDAGHGWLEVSIEDIRELNISHLISPYSYTNNGRVFLEEDCDASHYLESAKAKGWIVNMAEKYQQESFVRNLPRWRG